MNLHRIVERLLNLALVCSLAIVVLPRPGQAAGLTELPDRPRLALDLPDLERRSRSLDEFSGQVVLVNFWASWCGPCLVEMPGIQRLKEALDGRPFAVLAVNYRESREKVWRFRNLLKVDFPLLLDADGQTAADWQVTVYPTSYLVDAGGRIRYVAHGQLKWDASNIIETIEGMLNEQSIDVTVHGDPRVAGGSADGG